MNGSIHKKGDIYYLVFDTGRDPVTNQSKQKWLKVGKSKAEAKNKLAEMAKEINTNCYIEPAKMCLGEYMQKWLDHVAIKVRISTHESYVWASEHIVKGLGNIPLDKLKPLHIQDHLSTSMKSNLSSTSVRYQYNILEKP